MSDENDTREKQSKYEKRMKSREIQREKGILKLLTCLLYNFI